MFDIENLLDFEDIVYETTKQNNPELFCVSFEWSTIMDTTWATMAQSMSTLLNNCLSSTNVPKGQSTLC